MLDPDLVADNFRRGIDDFFHRIAMAGADIEGARGAAAIKVLQSAEMRPADIGYMNVITNAGAVGSWIVRAENLQRFSFAGIQDPRDQMSVMLAKLGGRVREFPARGI